MPEGELAPHLYLHAGADAVRHLFRVASSLDSLVVGEPQILGQVKDAYQFAREAGAVGMVLDRLLKKALSVAKLVRTETEIARSAVSVSFAAVELAKKIFGEIEGRSAMIIGAGEMAELAVKHLVSSGVREVFVVNRTFEKAVALAQEFGGSAVKYEDLFDQLVISDIVISSTGAPHFIIKGEDVKKVMVRRRHRPMFFIDIAVPRDIEPSVNDIDNAYLYNVDDLQSVVDGNIKERRKEADKAEKIVEEEVGTFEKWIASLQVVPTIVQLRQSVEAMRAAELEKSLGRLGAPGGEGPRAGGAAHAVDREQDPAQPADGAQGELPDAGGRGLPGGHEKALQSCGPPGGAGRRRWQWHELTARCGSRRARARSRSGRRTSSRPASRRRTRGSPSSWCP